ncbi:MAG: hypothetical protein UU05_C0030G0006 [Candidatus Curtissbacteria bacterium GW2011_GWA1_40_47]|nr:MAG: hypothetical protein UU05_C0030G0006 [Candidatus Curtissbacteria bacterium GW2011_GWA1_40_47]KKS27078.1 MAG: hypothetical protein UU88_C0012G0012 [Parcubacteria group bacterium GW2011_GWC1_42_11]KKS58379.1 MAG: hypothetical protein UV24_C0024G0005 [Candidatus Nomurabacteria bacterium GW2011_GWA2_42_41]TAN35712.1 MAG: type II secretion system protein [Patescibacteria group bacterium]HBC70735.1 hypothetical protein [Candidatus Campbellbacteria bacterium]
MKLLLSKNSKGFTLVEMIVSLGLFTIVLFIATSAFLSVINADRKSRATRIATDNLNLALEDMMRKIKTGYAYGCVGAGDCASGTAFSFTSQNGVNFIYKRGVGSGAIVSGTASSGCGSTFYTSTQGCLLREEGGTTVPMIATSPEIDIKSLKFAVSGSAVFPDRSQPVVVVTIDGSIGADLPNTAGKSAFSIQTVVTQRPYDM